MTKGHIGTREALGFGAVDSVYYAGLVLALKQSPSSLALTDWKSRFAVLAFGQLRLYDTATQSLAVVCSANSNTMIETECLSLNYCYVESGGRNAANGLYIIHLLSDLWQKRGQLHRQRRWFVLGLASLADYRQWMAAVMSAAAHAIDISVGKQRLPLSLVNPPCSIDPAETRLIPLKRFHSLSHSMWRFETRNTAPLTALVNDSDRKEGEDVDSRAEADRKVTTNSHHLYIIPVTLHLLSYHPIPLAPVAAFEPYEMTPLAIVTATLDRVYADKVGFGCLSEIDRELESATNSSLLYGEVLPAGVTKLFDTVHLNGLDALIVVDLGSGVGKLAAQVFLQYRNVQQVIGVELALSRFMLGRQALTDLMTDSSSENEGVGYEVIESSDTSITISELPHSTLTHVPLRSLSFLQGNMFTAIDIANADIVIVETLVTVECYHQFAALLESMKVTARLLTFGDIRPLWQSGQLRSKGKLVHSRCPFAPLTVSESIHDRFLTSWNVQMGHHFFLWQKVR